MCSKNEFSLFFGTNRVISYEINPFSVARLINKLQMHLYKLSLYSFISKILNQLAFVEFSQILYRMLIEKEFLCKDKDGSLITKKDQT